jgi:hypothetical protein
MHRLPASDWCQRHSRLALPPVRCADASLSSVVYRLRAGSSRCVRRGGVVALIELHANRIHRLDRRPGRKSSTARLIAESGSRCSRCLSAFVTPAASTAPADETVGWRAVVSVRPLDLRGCAGPLPQRAQCLHRHRRHGDRSVGRVSLRYEAAGTATSAAMPRHTRPRPSTSALRHTAGLSRATAHRMLRFAGRELAILVGDVAFREASRPRHADHTT